MRIRRGTIVIRMDWTLEISGVLNGVHLQVRWASMLIRRPAEVGRMPALIIHGVHHLIVGARQQASLHFFGADAADRLTQEQKRYCRAINIGCPFERNYFPTYLSRHAPKT